MSGLNMVKMLPSAIRLSVLGALVFNSPGWAQVTPLDKNASPLELSAAVIHSDNINPTVAEEVSANGIELGAQGKLLTTGGANWFGLDYALAHSEYSLDDSALLVDDSLSYSRYRLGGIWRAFLAENWQLDTALAFSSEDQLLGTGISRFRSDVQSPDRLDQRIGSVSLVYGSDTTSRYASLTLTHRDDAYGDDNAYASLFELSQTSADFSIGFRQSSATAWIFRVTAMQDDFDDVTRIDSDMVRVLAGIDWKPTGKTNLTLLVGGYQRSQDEVEDTSGFNWELGFETKPREDLSLSVQSSRISNISDSETETATDSVLENLNLGVTYSYSERWRIGLDLAAVNTEFDEANGVRELEERSAGVRLALHWRDYHKLELSLRRYDVSTSDDSIDFEQNEVRLDWLYGF